MCTEKVRERERNVLGFQQDLLLLSSSYYFFSFLMPLSLKPGEKRKSFFNMQAEYYIHVNSGDSSSRGVDAIGEMCVCESADVCVHS